MFDYKKLTTQRQKSIVNISKSDFYQFACKDIIDRLSPIINSFKTIAIIDSRINSIFSNILKTQYPNCILDFISSDHILSLDRKTTYDLIICPLMLHWISDIQSFLLCIKYLLHDHGIMICNFPAGGSLRKLRATLVALECKYHMPHAPHISPLIQFDQVVPLLQNTGFIENIIDMESFQFEYNTPLELMKCLSNVGESNALKNQVSYTITKQIYHDLAQKNEMLFVEHLNLVSFLSSPTKGSIKINHSHFT